MSKKTATKSNKIKSDTKPISKISESTRRKHSELWVKEGGELKPTHRFISSFYDPVPIATHINGEEANHILTYFNGYNRNLRASKVMGHVRAMLREEWKHGNDCLMFNEDGTRINGEHRLRAVVEAAKQKNPNDLAAFEIPFLVLTGQPDSLADIVDNGASRSLIDTATINGSIKKNDSDGKKALSLVFNSVLKTESGDTMNPGLCTKLEGLEYMERPFPSEPDKTYNEVAREAVDIMNNADATRPMYDGHNIALFNYWKKHPEKAKILWQLITSDSCGLRDLEKQGINTAMSGEDCPDENTAISKLRQELRARYSKKKVDRRSHGGGAFSDFHKEMIFVIQSYHDKTRVCQLKKRNLVTEEEYKQRNSKLNFHWGLLK